MSITGLQKLISAMDDEYPILEHLIIVREIKGSNEDTSTILILPEILQAPHLRHLVLVGFAIPVGSRLLTTAVGLVTLLLIMIHPSTYFHPNTLLQWLSFMPQLEVLILSFFFPAFDIERQLTHTPITAAATLPNLRHLEFQGFRTFSEAVIHRITAPHLEKLQIVFFNQLTFSVPHLLQFLNATENLTFKSAKFEFFDTQVGMKVSPHEEAQTPALFIAVNCWHLDWQVSSAAQIFNYLSPRLSAVENLTLEHHVHGRSSEEHNDADPTEWRVLLSSFRNTKTLRIGEGLVGELSRCLELDDGELPLGLLPELQELIYSGSGDTGDVFTSFVDARQDAGRPLTLVHRRPSQDQGSSVPSLEPPSISPASDEARSDLDTENRVVYPSPTLPPSPTGSLLLRRDVLAEDLATPYIP